MVKTMQALVQGLVVLACVMMMGCGAGKQTDGADLRGEVEGFTASRVYICRVVNQPYDYLVPLDTVQVKDGRFAWRSDTLSKDIYALAFVTDEKLMSDRVYVLLGEGRVDLKISSTSYGVLLSQSRESALQERYERFALGYRAAGLREELDSIEHAFYAARDRGDTATMHALNEENAALYDRAEEQKAQYISEQLADTTRDFFTFYLYYTYKFSRMSFVRQGQLDTIGIRLSEWQGADVMTSRLMRSARNRCAMAARSVEGAVAEEVEGVQADGDTLRLSSLRGRYVLVDFWASYCSWCRLEMPILKAAYERYGKAKGIEFLSVSLDRSREAWLRAVEEERMPWTNIRVSEAQGSAVTEGYSIDGIPLIVLIDGEGRIMRRGLRGEEVMQALAAL